MASIDGFELRGASGALRVTGLAGDRLDLSLPPNLAALVRESAKRLRATPRMLAIEVLEKVFDVDTGCLDAVLDRED